MALKNDLQPPERVHRRFTASSRRIGSQELLAASRSWRFALRANPPELLARPLGFPLRNLTPLRCRWESPFIERRSGVVRKERGQEHEETRP